MRTPLLAAAAAAAALAPLAARAQPVTIQHDPVAQAPPGAEVVVRARIRAAAGVFEPTLYWRPAGAKQFKGIPMGPAPAGAADEFGGILPAPAVKEDLEYYLEAYDKNLEGPARSGSASRPWKIRIARTAAARRLSIRSTPSSADVVLDGRAMGLTPFVADVPAGRHRLQLALAGYQAYEREFEMPQDRDHELALALARAAERLQLIVRSDPPGAVVEIDGVALGTTPYFGPAVPGRHAVGLRRPGFRRERREVEVQRDSSYDLGLVTLAVEEMPALEVESEPAGAELFLDGAAVGSTPYRGAVAPGDHELLLRPNPSSGLADTAASVTVAEGRGLRLRPALYPRDQGPRFTASSDPPGARVSVDGSFVGTTPFSGDVRAGDRTLALEREGFAPLRRAIKIAPGLNRELLVALSAAPARGPVSLTVNTSPQGAQLTLDGRAVGTSPWSGEIDPGAHAVIATLEGQRRVEQRFTAAGGQPLGIALGLSGPPAAGDQALLTVLSEPPGAQVLIDDQPAGLTPYSALAPAGEHALTLRREGFRARREVAVLPPDRAFELRLLFALEPDTGPAAPSPAPAAPSPLVPGAAAAALPAASHAGAGVPIPIGAQPTAGTLIVASAPAGARLLVDGAQIGQTPYRGTLSPGEHLVVLQRPLHRETAVFIDMPAGRDLDLSFPLQPTAQLMRQPLVSVISDPAGASVTLDGLEIGTTPREIEVASGDHTINVSKEGFSPAVREVVAEGGRRTEVVAVLPSLASHSPAPVAVKVDTEPQGAQLVLDGAAVGTSPADLSVRPGVHWLVARHPEHAELRVLFSAVPLRALRLGLPLPARGAAPALVDVATDPPGAAVLVDGDRLGSSPTRLPVPAGPHRFALQLDAHQPIEERIELAPTHEVRVQAVLQPIDPPARPRGGVRAAPRGEGFSLQDNAGPLLAMGLGGLALVLGGFASGSALSDTNSKIDLPSFTYSDYESNRRVSVLGDTVAVAGLIMLGGGALFLFLK